MGYKNWNDKSEVLCMLAFKVLEYYSFQRGMQNNLSKDISKITYIKDGSISAKISNYKSVAGINKPSNASNSTRKFYSKYKDYSVEKLKKELLNKFFGVSNEKSIFTTW